MVDGIKFVVAFIIFAVWRVAGACVWAVLEWVDSWSRPRSPD